MDRQQGNATAGELAFGEFRLVPHERALYRRSEPVRLTGRAFDLLLALVERAGTVVGKDDLMARVWPRTFVEEGNLRVHIGTLRKALGTDRPYVENVVGRGYSFVAPVRQLPFFAEAPAAPAAPPAPRLVGRDDVLAQLAEHLAHERLLTIAGPAGMGKTAVALALAARVAPLSGQQVLCADLAALAGPLLLPGAVAQLLGIPAAGRMTDAPGGRRVLLILDSCDHMIAAAAALADELLRAGAGVQIVATSREPLRAEHERVYRLQPLAVPPDGSVTAAALAACPSAQLFAERASAGGGFVPDDASAAAVADICRRLDGIPLALELAAGRAAFFGVDELARRLAGSFAVLTRGRRTALPRHQTLRAALDWSHDTLAPKTRIVLRRLAVFRAPFTLEAATAVAQGGEVAARSVPCHMAQLVAKSFVVADGGDDGCRLLNTTRAYALEQLRAGGEEHAAAQRHARYWCALLTGAGNDGGNNACERLTGAAWLQRHGRVIDHVRAALDWAFAPGGDALLGARLAAVSAPLWYELSLMDEYRGRLALALAAAAGAGAGSASLSMALQLALGHTLLHVGGAAPAVRTGAFGQALALATQLGDHAAAVRALWGCFTDALFQGEYAATLGHARRFSALAGVAGIDGAGVVHHRLHARALHYLGDQHAARAHIAAIVGHPARRSHGVSGFQFDQRVSSLAIHGHVLWLQGSPDQALLVAREAVEEAQRLDHAISLCLALLVACSVALWCGDLAAARRYTDLMMARAGRDNLAQWQFWARLFDTALRRHEGAGHVAADGLAADALCAGLHLDMLPTLHERLLAPRSLARALAGRAGWAEAELLRCWGQELVRVGAYAQATRVFRQALAQAAGQGALAWELRAATSLARVLVLRGQAGEAADVLRPVLARVHGGRSTRDVGAAEAVLAGLR